MGSNGREIEKEQLDNYYAESTVFVAVGKNLKESESVLSWAIGKFAGKKRICILHIHQPGQLVTFSKPNHWLLVGVLACLKLFAQCKILVTSPYYKGFELTTSCNICQTTRIDCGSGFKISIASRNQNHIRDFSLWLSASS